MGMSWSDYFETSNRYIEYQIGIEETGYDIASNTSTFATQLWIWRSNTGYTTYGNGTAYWRIRTSTGEVSPWYSASMDSSDKITHDGLYLAYDTWGARTHANDGTFSITVDAYFSHSQFSSDVHSYTINATTIPLASVFGTISGTTIGSDMTVNITRYSSSFTNELWYRIGSTGWVLVGTGIATSKTFTLPMSLCNQIPNATSGTLELSIVTYYGSNKIGEVTKTVTVSVPSSVVPSVTLSVAEAVTDVKNKLGVYVKDLSKLSVSASGSGSYGSSISSYSISANGTIYNSNSFTTGALISAGNMTITATVTDSRGRIGSTSTTISVQDYTKPYINTFSVARCNQDGSDNDEGTYFKVIYKMGITNISGNTPTYKLSYKKKNDTTYTDIVLATSGATLDSSRIVPSIDINYTYDVKISVADQFYSTENASVLGTAFTLMDFNSSGKGMSIGKVSEGDGLDVNLETTFKKDVTFTDGATLKGIVANNLSTESEGFVLDARQGKALNDLVNSKAHVYYWHIGANTLDDFITNLKAWINAWFINGQIGTFYGSWSGRAYMCGFATKIDNNIFGIVMLNGSAGAYRFDETGYYAM